MDDVTIKIYEIIQSPIAVAVEDGQLVHDIVVDEINQGHRVVLSFANITRTTSAFLNVAIGQLYSNFSEEEVRAHLTFVDTFPEDRILIRRVSQRAKEYFADKDRFDEANQSIFGVDAY